MDIVNLRDLDALAEATLDPATWAYYSGGAGDETTLRDNDEAWARHRLRPRVLVDTAPVDPSTTVLGTPVRMPVGVAPTALHGRGADDGEVASARAAAAAGALYTASTLSSRPLEEIAGVGGPQWFQLYAHADRAIAGDVVARAEASGFRAIVLTVDLPVLGRRDREARAGYAAGVIGDYGTLARYGSAGTGLHTFGLTWDDIAWLRGITDLPLVLKGILTGEDASVACEHGVDGVWVSNHGARQLDRVAATADVLEECVDAVAGRAEVYVDGGVRRGTDVATALALGARAAFVGRPVLYALAVGGEAGVGAALGLLHDELVTAMTLLGTATVGAITRSHVA